MARKSQTIYNSTLTPKQRQAIFMIAMMQVTTTSTKYTTRDGLLRERLVWKHVSAASTVDITSRLAQLKKKGYARLDRQTWTWELTDKGRDAL